MGARAVNAAVADAGPLIHLAEVDGLALLRIFAALHIPDAVWSEAVALSAFSYNRYTAWEGPCTVPISQSTLLSHALTVRKHILAGRYACNHW